MAKNKGKGKGKGKGLLGQYKDSGMLKPLSGKRLRRETRAASRLQFGPEGRQLHAEQRASQVQQRRIGDWFGQYQDTLRQMQRSSAQGYGQAIQGYEGQAQQGSEYAEQLRQRLRAENEESAQQRGATYDPSLDAQAQQANLQRQQLSQSTSGMLRSQGASQNAYLADKQRIGKGEMLNQLLREAARGRSVNADLRDLAQRKGAFRTEYRSQLRPQERDFYLGLLQARLGNKANKLEAKTSAANSRRTAQTSRQNSRRSAQQSDINSRRSAQTSRQNNRRSNRDDKGGGKGGNVDKTHVQQMIADLRLTKPKKLKKWNRKEILARLMQGSTTYTRGEAQRALRRYHRGGKKGGNNPGPGSGHHAGP